MLGKHQIHTPHMNKRKSCHRYTNSQHTYSQYIRIGSTSSALNTQRTAAPKRICIAHEHINIFALIISLIHCNLLIVGEFKPETS